MVACSYETFKAFIDEAGKMFKKTDEFADTYGFDVYEHFFGKTFDRAVDVIKEAIGDNGDWIPFFIYDMYMGDDYIPGCREDEDGNAVSLATARDLYDLLDKEI